MKKIKKNLKWLTIIFIIILISTIFALKLHLTNNVTPSEQSEEIILEENQLENKKEVEVPLFDNVFVDIKGAVALPGVYEIAANKKVIDVIQLAGGFTEEADTSLINLAKAVVNEMVIIIYTKKEVEQAMKDKNLEKIVDKQCICPTIQNDACLKSEIEANTSIPPKKEEGQVSKKVNLNTATLEELQTLSGIGISKAQAIIKYRDEHGSFKTIEEIQEVTGIGTALYEKIKNDITI